MHEYTDHGSDVVPIDFVGESKKRNRSNCKKEKGWAFLHNVSVGVAQASTTRA
jgi:hypothetical protein